MIGSPAWLLERITDRRPLSARSLIVTVFGDAIHPRGGKLSLAALTTILERFAINPGQIRTALSRLVADGWFERSREGRASYYELAAGRVAEFEAASHRIYAARPPSASMRFEQIMYAGDDLEKRAAMRAELERAGFGQLASGVLIRPERADRVALEESADDLARGVLELRTGADDLLRSIACSAWPIDDLGRQYGVVASELSDIEPSSIDDGASAFIVRILAVHEFRRVALRDPMLPLAMLPEPWPGDAARDRVAAIYRAVWQRSERWLECEARASGDALPVAAHDGSKRFDRP